MKTRRSVSILTTLFLLAPLARAAERKAVEEVLPSGSLFFFRVRDIGQFKDLVQGKNPLLKEPAIQGLLDKAEISADSIARMFEDKVGVPLKDLLEVLEGSAGIALYPAASGNVRDDPSILVGLSVKAGSETKDVWSKLQGKIREKRKDFIVREKEESFEGADLWTVVFKEDRGGKPSDKEREAVFSLHEGMFLASTDRGPVEKTLLAVAGKDAKPIAMTDEYRAATNGFAKAQDYLGVLDLDFVNKAIEQTAGRRRRAASGGDDGGDLGKKAIQALGLDVAQTVSFGVGSTDEALELRAYLHAPGKRTGILKLLSPKSSALEPDKFAPSDAVGAGVLHLDPAEVLNTIERILDEMSPDMASSFQMGLDMIEGQTSVNLKKDLLEQLLPPIYFVQMPGGAPQAGINPDRSLIYMRVRDQKRLEESIKNLITGGSQGTANLKESEYLGYKINTLEIDLPEGMMPEGVTLPRPSFVVTDSHFFFSNAGTGPIEDALRTIGKETKLLSASADYRRALVGLPEERWMVSFVRLAANLETALANLKALANMMDNEAEEVMRAIAKIDPVIFRRYVDVMGFAATSDERGVLLAGRITYPSKTAAPAKEEK